MKLVTFRAADGGVRHGVLHGEADDGRISELGSGDLLGLVVRQGMMLTLAGAVAGVVGALALGRTLSSLLYGVTAADFTAFGAALVLSIVTALFACWLPARRAASLNPLDGLRT